MLFPTQYPRNEINFMYCSVTLFLFSVILPYALGLLSRGRQIYRESAKACSMLFMTIPLTYNHGKIPPSKVAISSENGISRKTGKHQAFSANVPSFIAHPRYSHSTHPWIWRHRTQCSQLSWVRSAANTL